MSRRRHHPFCVAWCGGGPRWCDIQFLLNERHVCNAVKMKLNDIVARSSLR